jgi:hypothetical protein
LNEKKSDLEALQDKFDQNERTNSFKIASLVDDLKQERHHRMSSEDIFKEMSTITKRLQHELHKKDQLQKSMELSYTAAVEQERERRLLAERTLLDSKKTNQDKSTPNVTECALSENRSPPFKMTQGVSTPNGRQRLLLEERAREFMSLRANRDATPETRGTSTEKKEQRVCTPLMRSSLMSVYDVSPSSSAVVSKNE